MVDVIFVPAIEMSCSDFTDLISQFCFIISDKAFCIKEHAIGKTMVYNKHH